MANQNDEVSVMLMMRSGSIRDGLLALLSSIKGISRIDFSDDPARSLQRVVTWQPNLAIVEGNGFGEEIWSMLPETKRKSPRTRFIWFAENLPEMIKEVDFQIEAVIQQGVHPDDLVRLIENLLQEAKEKKEM